MAPHDALLGAACKELISPESNAQHLLHFMERARIYILFCMFCMQSIRKLSPHESEACRGADEGWRTSMGAYTTEPQYGPLQEQLM